MNPETLTEIRKRHEQDLAAARASGQQVWTQAQIDRAVLLKHIDELQRKYQPTGDPS